MLEDLSDGAAAIGFGQIVQQRLEENRHLLFQVAMHALDGLMHNGLIFGAVNKIGIDCSEERRIIVQGLLKGLAFRNTTMPEYFNMCEMIYHKHKPEKTVGRIFLDGEPFFRFGQRRQEARRSSEQLILSVAAAN